MARSIEQVISDKLRQNRFLIRCTVAELHPKHLGHANKANEYLIAISKYSPNN